MQPVISVVERHRGGAARRGPDRACKPDMSPRACWNSSHRAPLCPSPHLSKCQAWWKGKGQDLGLLPCVHGHEISPQGSKQTNLLRPLYVTGRSVMVFGDQLPRARLTPGTAAVTQLRQSPPLGAVPLPLCHMSSSESRVHGHTDSRRKGWASPSRLLLCVLGYGDVLPTQSAGPLTPGAPLRHPRSQCCHPSSVFRVSGPCGGEGWQGWVHARHRDPSGLPTTRSFQGRGRHPGASFSLSF